MTPHQYAMWILNRCTELLRYGVVRVEYRSAVPERSIVYTLTWTLNGKSVSYRFDDSEFVRIEIPETFLKMILRILKRKMYLQKEA